MLKKGVEFRLELIGRRVLVFTMRIKHFGSWKSKLILSQLHLRLVFVVLVVHFLNDDLRSDFIYESLLIGNLLVW